MHTSSLPGFTAEASLSTTRGYYRSAAGQGCSGVVEQVVAPQISIGGLGSVGQPFSGSCGCWPGFCCCILCYFDRCTLWCWLTELQTSSR
jgi:hypothetical protein